MRLASLLLLVLLVPGALAQGDVDTVLDDFHLAASDADFERYFGHFALESIFIGTDITERWTVEEFKEYARPHFEAGNGWSYVPEERFVYVAGDQQTAWFDEILHNASFGRTRGTGVLVMEEGVWKVAQYHLTLPVPNELIYDLVDMIGGR
ncbi:MAG: nuclear transport factor 2 family protein [Bacteroidota bacterium]|nr:nuclear transport factor 2 family protein [Bacteroidota bacterium]MDE2957134.1 nuclear transport factor 2 family protein [Bacteroidota bacterium]